MAYTDLTTSFNYKDLLTWQLMDSLAENDNAIKNQAISLSGVKTFTDSPVIAAPLITEQYAASGSAVELLIENTANAASSDALLHLKVGGTSANDPYAYFQIPSGTSWAIGVDNSDSDKFKISKNATLGTNDFLAIDTAGILTLNCASPTIVFTPTGTSYATLQIGGGTTGLYVGQEGSGAGGSLVASSAALDCVISSYGAHPLLFGTNNAIRMTIDTNGVMTRPAQTCFLAYNSSTDLNQTGAGTTVKVDFDTEVFDVGSNFAADTFTAPVTGKYILIASVKIEDLTAAMTAIQIDIVTSNRTYTYNKTITPAAGGIEHVAFPVLADMDASDTAYVNATVAGGAGNTADITGTASPVTFFAGYLMG